MAAVLAPPLDQSYGYGIVLGLGIGFGVMMYGEAFLEKRYLHANLESSESYMTGDRAVKTGMVASAGMIISMRNLLLIIHLNISDVSGNFL